MKKMTKFTELGLDKSLLDVIEKLGYSTPFPIQERAIPVLLENNDVIGQAHTGTGKTAAYGLPILQLTIPKQGIQGVIMAPPENSQSKLQERSINFQEILELRLLQFMEDRVWEYSLMH